MTPFRHRVSGAGAAAWRLKGPFSGEPTQDQVGLLLRSSPSPWCWDSPGQSVHRWGAAPTTTFTLRASGVRRTIPPCARR